MSIHDFKKQKQLEETPEMKELSFTNSNKIPDINNTDKYDWHQVGTDKYGRYMYCPKTNIKRVQTMGEFYGTSIVD